MLTIVIPAHYRELSDVLDQDWPHEDVFVGALPFILSNTDIDTEVILSVQGGIPEDLEQMKDFLNKEAAKWSICHDREIRGSSRAISDALPSCSGNYIAVLMPNIIVRDPRWFGKMQEVFLKVPHPGLVALPDECENKASLPPFQIPKRYHHPSAGLVLTTKTSLSINKPSPSVADWTVGFSERCARNGSSRWLHRGVLFSKLEQTQVPEARR